MIGMILNDGMWVIVVLSVARNLEDALGMRRPVLPLWIPAFAGMTGRCRITAPLSFGHSPASGGNMTLAGSIGVLLGFGCGFFGGAAG